jgi:cytochrome b subunit of formate dehydrogenase
MLHVYYTVMVRIYRMLHVYYTVMVRISCRIMGFRIKTHSWYKIRAKLQNGWLNLLGKINFPVKRSLTKCPGLKGGNIKIY